MALAPSAIPSSISVDGLGQLVSSKMHCSFHHGDGQVSASPEDSVLDEDTAAYQSLPAGLCSPAKVKRRDNCSASRSHPTKPRSGYPSNRHRNRSRTHEDKPKEDDALALGQQPLLQADFVNRIPLQEGPAFRAKLARSNGNKQKFHQHQQMQKPYPYPQPHSEQGHLPLTNGLPPRLLEELSPYADGSHEGSEELSITSQGRPVVEVVSPTLGGRAIPATAASSMRKPNVPSRSNGGRQVSFENAPNDLSGSVMPSATRSSTEDTMEAPNHTLRQMGSDFLSSSYTLSEKSVQGVLTPSVSEIPEKGALQAKVARAPVTNSFPTHLDLSIVRHGVLEEKIEDAGHSRSISTQTPTLESIPPPDLVATELTNEVESALNDELWSMYERLRPNEADMVIRKHFVEKLQRIFDQEWSVHRYIVHPFGSTVNQLCSRQSDVDVCLTSLDQIGGQGCGSSSGRRGRHGHANRPGRGQHDNHGGPVSRHPSDMMCEIADILRSHGYRDIDLRKARARVPVVRFTDPELQVSCDINVNNPLALHNTLYVKHYVGVNPLVAPFMLIVKYWTQRRVLNDAAGGSLSNYCWTILMLYFLQRIKLIPTTALRDISAELAAWESPSTSGTSASQHARMPPFPPRSALMVNAPPAVQYGTKCNSLNGRTYSLAALFFHFFRYFALQFDFESSVIALRGAETIDWESARMMVPQHEEAAELMALQGILQKKLKLWAASQLPPRDYRPLCVEDPLNPLRNLANNASLTTVNGIQKEMWRVCYILTAEPLYLDVAVPPPGPEPPAGPGEVLPITLYLSYVCEKFTFPGPPLSAGALPETHFSSGSQIQQFYNYELLNTSTAPAPNSTALSHNANFHVVPMSAGPADSWYYLVPIESNASSNGHQVSVASPGGNHILHHQPLFAGSTRGGGNVQMPRATCSRQRNPLYPSSQRATSVGRGHPGNSNVGGAFSRREIGASLTMCTANRGRERRLSHPHCAPGGISDRHICCCDDAPNQFAVPPTPPRAPAPSQPRSLGATGVVLAASDPMANGIFDSVDINGNGSRSYGRPRAHAMERSRRNSSGATSRPGLGYHQASSHVARLANSNHISMPGPVSTFPPFSQQIACVEQFPAAPMVYSQYSFLDEKPPKPIQGMSTHFASRPLSVQGAPHFQTRMHVPPAHPPGSCASQAGTPSSRKERKSPAENLSGEFGQRNLHLMPNATPSQLKVRKRPSWSSEAGDLILPYSQAFSPCATVAQNTMEREIPSAGEISSEFPSASDGYVKKLGIKSASPQPKSKSNEKRKYAHRKHHQQPSASEDSQGMIESIVPVNGGDEVWPSPATAASPEAPTLSRGRTSKSRAGRPGSESDVSWAQVVREKSPQSPRCHSSAASDGYAECLTMKKIVHDDCP